MATYSTSHLGACGPCTLCKKQSFRYTHAENIGESEKTVISKFSGKSLPDTACICQACILQVKKNLDNDNFRPRWLPKQAKTLEICCIENCKHPADKNTTLVTPEQLEKVLDIRVVAFTVGGDGTQAPLCLSHYRDMYVKVYTPINSL